MFSTFSDDIIREKFHQVQYFLIIYHCNWNENCNHVNFFQYKAPSNADGISPFFRKPNVVLRSRPQHFFSQKTQFKSKLSDYSNYLNHMAKKRVQRAHRNLDLRRRLIHIRAIKDKVDLRWKIVALMISKLKTSAPSGSFEYNQQPAINYQIQPSNLHTRGNECHFLIKKTNDESLNICNNSWLMLKKLFRLRHLCSASNQPKFD